MKRNVVIALIAFIVIGTNASKGDVTSPHLDQSGINLQPNYPSSALSSREQGSIIVDAEVLESGNVNRVLLLQSTGFDDLDKAGIAAVLGWHFIPAKTDGKPTTGWIKEQIAFAPPDSAAMQGSVASKPYFPASFKLTAGYKDTTRRTMAIPCPKGSLLAVVRFTGTQSATEPKAKLELSSGAESAAVVITRYDGVTPPLQTLSMTKEENGRANVVDNNETPAPSGVARLAVSWDQQGTIQTYVTHSRRHVTKMMPPTNFSFAVTSASAEFSDPKLICWSEAASGDPEEQ